MSHSDDREGLESQYDINLVNAEIIQIQREQAEAEAAAAAAAAAAASAANASATSQALDHQHETDHNDSHANAFFELTGDIPSQLHQPERKKRKRKIYQTEDGIKKCSRCRVKRVDEPSDVLEKYATCLNCRTKRKIDNRKHHEETEYLLPSAKSTADALTAAMNASRNEASNIKTDNTEHPEQQQQSKSKKAAKRLSVEDYYHKEVARRQRVKDYADLPNLYTHYGDFVERIRLNCEHDLFDHHFRGYADENLIPRYKLEDVDAETFQYVSRKIINIYIQPLMDVTGYRFPVRDYHKGGSKSKKITFMFICSQDKTKQRKSRSTDQRKIANRLKVNECDSKINLNYDLCSGFLQINYNHKAHHPYMWKAESIQLHKNSNQYMDEVDNENYHHHDEENGNNAGVLQASSNEQEDSTSELVRHQHQDQDHHQHHHHHHHDESDNIDLNLIDSIPASSMQYLTGVDEEVAAVVNAHEQERDQERQAELDRQAVEDAANQFLQAQARQLKEENDESLEQAALGQPQEEQDEQELEESDKPHMNVDNIDQELLNMG